MELGRDWCNRVEKTEIKDFFCISTICQKLIQKPCSFLQENGKHTLVLIAE